jgi:hypothetical protein
MGNLPLDIERRCEQRWASRFSAARGLREQHRLEGLKQRQKYVAVDRLVRPRWIVTHELSEWREEIAWMSLYFSGAVWASLALCVFYTAAFRF